MNREQTTAPFSKKEYGMKIAVSVLLVIGFAITACSTGKDSTDMHDLAFRTAQVAMDNDANRAASTSSSSSGYVDGYVVTVEDTTYNGVWLVAHWTEQYVTVIDSVQYLLADTVVDARVSPFDAMHVIRHMDYDYTGSDAYSGTTLYRWDLVITGMQQPTGQLKTDGAGTFDWDVVYHTTSGDVEYTYDGTMTLTDIGYDYVYDTTGHAIDPPYPVGGTLVLNITDLADYDWVVTVTFDGTDTPDAHCVSDNRTWDWEVQLY
jgi:hypothetical protein